MKDLLKMVAVLTVICTAAGVLLAVINKVTAEPISAAVEAEKTAAIRAVLPACDNNPVADAVRLPVPGGEREFYPAFSAGAYAGAAFLVSTPNGYGGDIDIMVGVAADDTVQAIRILAHKETPGLGARIVEPAFLDPFTGKPLDGTDWRVRKDGGAIDEITAATISSRAVTDAVAAGLAAYGDNKERLVALKPET